VTLPAFLIRVNSFGWELVRSSVCRVKSVRFPVGKRRMTIFFLNTKDAEFFFGNTKDAELPMRIPIRSSTALKRD
jgi:hypothetical protein